MKKRSIIIDTDPGIDDAFAIGLAAKNLELDVKLISTVAGNVPVESTTKNALKLVEFFGIDVPVARGCSQPLLRTLECSDYVHGADGMGEYPFPEPQVKPLEKHAVEAMKDVILASEDKVTLVVIGVETNIAILFKMYPEVKEKIEEIVIMGGSTVGGNVTAAAEFNIYNDPHAAEIVFQSGVPITMAGLDVTHKSLIHEGAAKVLNETSEVGKVLYTLLDRYANGEFDGTFEEGVAVHDIVTIAYILKPEIFESEMRYVQVHTEGIAAGATVFDRRDHIVCNEPNVKVLTNVDAKAYEEWVIAELCKM